MKAASRLLLPMLCLFALPSFAQFQQPTPDELKMTADPAAPGAAAVYLNIEEHADDNLHYKSVYTRIKVLSDKGKSLARISIPYEKEDFKITGINGRTIHPDGTIIPLTVKAEELMIEKKGDDQFARKVFTLPSVEVGSILEYKYEIRYDDNLYSSPEWEIQRDYYVHKSRYSFTPFKAFLSGRENATGMYLIDHHGNPVNTLMWVKNLPGKLDLKADARGVYSLEVNDVPAAPDEDFMPPISSSLYRVKFYYMNSHSTQQYWLDEARYWDKDVNQFTEQSKKLKEAVATIVAPSDAPIDKARKIYDAVQALENTAYTRSKSASELKQLKLKEIRHAEEVWERKSGSPSELTLLFVTMARIAGLDASAMRVDDRRDHVFNLSYLNFYQLDDTLALLRVDGQQIPLDPGEKYCPFKHLHWRHLSTVGITQDAKQNDLVVMPHEGYNDNRITRMGSVTLAADGHITGSYQAVYTGQAALEWRQKSLLNDAEELKKLYDKELERITPDGVEAHIDHFIGLDTPETNLIALVKLTGNLGVQTGHRVMLPGFFFESRGLTPFVKLDKRQTAVDMEYPSQVVEQMSYILPEGFSAQGVPADRKEVWDKHSVFGSKTVSAPGKIIVGRSLSTAFTKAEPEEYGDLRSFYQKIASDDEQQIVLSNESIKIITGN